MTGRPWNPDRRIPRSYSLRESTHDRVRFVAELTGQSASATLDEVVTVALDLVQQHVNRSAGSEDQYQTVDALRRTYPNRYRAAIDAFRNGRVGS